MKIKINKDLSINHAGFAFRNGIAEVAPEDEEKARRISRLLGYEIIEDKAQEAPNEEPKEEPKEVEEEAPKEEPKKAPAKPKANPKAKTEDKK